MTTTVSTPIVQHIVRGVTQGIPGPTGPAGPSRDLLQYISGEALGGNRMVVLDAGIAFYADNTTATHANKVLGVTTGAAILGALATIQTGGEITEPSWSWTADLPIFLGVSGLLTQTPPTTGFSQIVGFPITATTILINLREPIIL